jgi:putative Mn2+ efflux pump MntP
MLASIPAFFLGVGAAFWRRALWLAVLLIGLGALMKVVRSFAIGDDSARTLVPPAVFGFLVTALAVALGTGRLRRRSTS